MRPRPTFADYVAVAISPVLIGVLVASLVFFLIEVFYQGAHSLRLQYIMAMFVMGAVGVSRISIEEGREQAFAFGIPLAIVTAIAAFRFVEFRGPLSGISPLISIGLIALIWWCADRLVWDCTVIDEHDESGAGEGLLQTVGLEREEALDDGTTVTPERTLPEGSSPGGLWQRFLEYRRRPHAPGVWVLYFSLAALPIFGIGQAFIRASDLDSRRFVFHLLVIYVASGLGLLMSTSFLGLRRYLRRRRLEMPTEMAQAWVGGGTVAIAAVLLVCLALPRTNAAYSISHLSFMATSPGDLSPSEWAFGDDSPEDAESDSNPAGGETGAPDGSAPPEADSADSPAEGGDRSAGETGEPTGSSQQGSPSSESGESGSDRSSSDQASSDSSQSPPLSQPESSPSESPPGRPESGSGQSPPSQSPESQSPSSQSPGSQSPGSQSPGSQSPGSQSADSQSADGQSADNQSADRQASESRSADSQSSDSQSSDSQSSDSQSPDSQSPQRPPSDGQSSESSAGDNPPDEDSASGQRADRESQDPEAEDPSRAEEESAAEQSRRGERGGADRSRDDQRGGGQQNRSQDRGSDTESSSAGSNSPSQISPAEIVGRFFSSLGAVVQFLYWAVILAVVAFLLWRHHAAVARAVREFLDALRNFWSRLFGRREPEVQPELEAPTLSVPTKRFADFPDPFQSGAAERISLDELIDYSFQAFEAWGRERGYPRAPEQTPHEFARVVGRQVQSLSNDALRLAELYSWSAYARESVPAQSIEHLRRLWQRLQQNR